MFGADSQAPTLFRLQAITALDLCSYPLSLSPDVFERIIAAWPNTHHLELRQHCDITIPPLKTEDLLPFATACLKLDILGVYGSAVALARHRSDKLASMPKKLAVGKSEINKSAYQATFVSSAFPTARVVKYICDTLGQREQSGDSSDQRGTATARACKPRSWRVLVYLIRRDLRVETGCSVRARSNR